MPELREVLTAHMRDFHQPAYEVRPTPTHVPCPFGNRCCIHHHHLPITVLLLGVRTGRWCRRRGPRTRSASASSSSSPVCTCTHTQAARTHHTVVPQPHSLPSLPPPPPLSNHTEPPAKPIILSEALVWAATLAIAAPLGYDVRGVDLDADGILPGAVAAACEELAAAGE